MVGLPLPASVPAAGRDAGQLVLVQPPFVERPTYQHQHIPAAV